MNPTSYRLLHSAMFDDAKIAYKYGRNKYFLLKKLNRDGSFDSRM